LRVYLRDKEAAYREKNLSLLLKQTIPIPQVYFIGDYVNYRFAITEYIHGITLRDLLLGNQSYDLNSMMLSVGKMLSIIQTHRFDSAGFFNKELIVAEITTQDTLLQFDQECLKHTSVIQALGMEIITKIKLHIDHFKSYIPDDHDNHLVHADFDPANILVDIKNGQWEITGILDWEFSFSGSPLWDVANMLRYAHQMPVQFEESFLKGLKEGYDLPPDFHISIYLLNLSSLLDCLTRCPYGAQSNQCSDIRALINFFIIQLDNSL
jgi:aminoglycoside phosphotransferase (APT) family kinase protein